MSQPLFWPSQAPFCPVGDTAPISLTQDLAPEQPANILLLGCGDPRNILFTLSADVVAPTGPRKLDITCCDIEPAVLARNILLFTLLDDKEHIDRVWDIFYHFKIDGQASTVLTHQSQRLYESAQDIEIWRQSPYGSFIQFVDTRTLAELRRHWKSYGDFPNLPPDRHDQLLEQQSKLSDAVLNKKNHYTSASLVTGMFSAQAATPLSNLYKRYWKTGIIIDQDNDVQTTTSLNPTFVYSASGEAFNLHPSTFPQGFHLTSAMTPTLPDITEATPGTEPAIVNIMKQQFKKWADAFLASRAGGAITLRFFSGDALAFCHALDFYSYTGNPSTGVPISMWRAAQINLEMMRGSVPPAPTTFDVIDTSDLADHLGLFNLLLATRPLLKEDPLSQAILYTETTLCAGKDPIRPFMDRIFSTIPTISVLLGIAPRAYVSGFTSHFNVHEVLTPQHIDRYHERVAWVDPSSGDPHTSRQNTVSFDAENLAQIIFGIYDKMFAPEQFEPLMIHGAKLKAGIPLRYHRETVVMLLKLVKRRVHLKTGDWDVVAKNFLGLYERARYVLSAGVYNEDISAQLHLHSVHTVMTLGPDWRIRFAASHSSGLFRDWPSLPSLLCVVFTIPRRNLQVLLEHDNKNGVPTLECRLSWTNGESHTYSSVHAIWGKCATAKGSDTVTLEEDPDGIRGNSDLVLMFWGASRIIEFTDMSIILALKKATDSTQEFSRKLGAKLSVFSARLDDKNHVQILPYRPSLASENPLTLETILASSPSWANSANGSVSAGVGSETSSRHVVTLTARVNIDSPAEQESLLAGADVTTVQISPCTMKLSIADYHHMVPYPYPILSSKSRLRVARKSHYVEIIVPMSDPLDSGGYHLDRAPIIQNSTYSPWNIHHISLDLMPRVNLEDPKKLEWLWPHLAFQLSNRELDISNGDSAAKSAPTNALLNVKESIRTIVTHCSGVQGTKTRVFGLSETDSGSAYAILLVGDLRLDLASFTVVIDAALLPVSTERASSLASSIEKLRNEHSVVQVITSGEETAAWKNLLPAFVERCRTWSHKPNCEYAARGGVPLMVNTGENLICSCGAGVGFKGPEWETTSWEDLLLFATRAAISPLFPVSFVEYGSRFSQSHPSQPMMSGSLARSQRWLDDECWSVQKGKVLLGYMSKSRLESA